jgi:hypothetical protein
MPPARASAWLVARVDPSAQHSAKSERPKAEVTTAV